MKKKVEKEGAKKKEMITVEVKKQIIEMYERGMRVVDIAKLYNKSTSTICTVLKKKEEIRGLDAAKGVTRISKQRPPVLEDVEKLLLVWITEKQQAGDLLTENLICEKARSLYVELVSKLPGSSTEDKEGFKASRGWFDNFKRRSGFKVKHGEGVSSDARVTEVISETVNNTSLNEQKEESSLQLLVQPSTSTQTESSVGVKRRKRDNSLEYEEIEDDIRTVLRTASIQLSNSDEYAAFGNLISHKIRNLQTVDLRRRAQNQIWKILVEFEMCSENNEGSPVPEFSMIETFDS